METIELEKGWLIRQMVEVRREAENWPEVMKSIITINASLVHQPSDSDQSSVAHTRHTKSEKSLVEK
jgi:hypothetical protein